MELMVVTTALPNYLKAHTSHLFNTLKMLKKFNGELLTLATGENR